MCIRDRILFCAKYFFTLLGRFLASSSPSQMVFSKKEPNKVKKYFAQNNITVYYINATQIAQEIGLGNRTNTKMCIRDSSTTAIKAMPSA